MNEPILGTFMLQMLDENDEPLISAPTEPLSFEEAVAALITGHEAHPHIARDTVISAARNGVSTFMDSLTHQATRIVYSA